LPKKHSKVLQVLDLGMNDSDSKVREYAAAYVEEYAGKNFSQDLKGYAEWYAANRDKDPNELLKENEGNAGTLSKSAGPATKAEELAQQGWLLWQQTKFDEAIKQFQGAIQLDPKSTAALNGLGWSLFNGGRSDDAIDAFEKCIAIDPKHPAALNGLGQIYLNRGDFDKAEKYLLKAAPDAPAAQFGLGRLYLLTGKYDEAKTWLEKAAAGGPSDPMLKQMLEAAKKGELPKGLKIQIQPPENNEDSKTSDLNAKAWGQFFQHDFKTAEANFRKTLEDSPDNSSAMNGLGFCLLNQGHAKEAQPYFEKILAKEPDAGGPLNGLARCLKDQGKTDEAIKTWEHAYKIAPGPNDISGNLAEAYVETKQYTKAVPIFEMLVKANPKDERLHNRLEAARRGVKEAEADKPK
jgi:Flp pilus assembly protein TadD